MSISWKKQNPDKVREQKRRYRERKKALRPPRQKQTVEEKKRLSRERYRNLTPEEKIAYQASTNKWREENRNRYNELIRNWNRRNREKVNKAKRKSHRYSVHRRKAKERGLRTFFTGYAMYDEFIARPCTYCGQTPALGVDRIDSKLGYTPENSTPCCYRCNSAKNDMTAQEFYAWIDRVQAYRLD